MQVIYHNLFFFMEKIQQKDKLKILKKLFNDRLDAIKYLGIDWIQHLKYKNTWSHFPKKMLETIKYNIHLLFITREIK